MSSLIHYEVSIHPFTDSSIYPFTQPNQYTGLISDKLNQTLKGEWHEQDIFNALQMI